MTTTTWGTRLRSAPPWALLVTLGAYALAAVFVVPTLAPVALSDDWIYSRVVETLVREHRLHLGELPSSILVGQAAWGAVFTTVFGFSFGVLRSSTLVMSAIGGVGVYGLSRELGVERGRAAAGAAAVLFNPLAYVLSQSFMTDMHFVSWLILATWAYARGVRCSSSRAILLGSGLASMALLVRQQGLLIPLAVSAAVLLRRRDREALRTVVTASLLPVVTLVLYYVALALGDGIPEAQRLFFTGIRQAGPGGIVAMSWRLPYIQMVSVGLICLPFCVAVKRWPQRLARILGDRRPDRALLVGCCFALLAFVKFGSEGRLVPLSPHFASLQGLGPNDLLGDRLILFGIQLRWALSAIAAAAGLAAVSLIVRTLRAPRRAPSQAGAMPTATVLTGAVLVGQFLGAFPPSFLFLRFADLITLDRYVLPTMALSVPLLLAASRRLEMHMPVVVVVIVIFGAFAVVGTRDHLVYEKAIWSTAEEIHAAGVPLVKLDAGPAWDGWHVGSGDFPLGPSHSPHPTWWLDVWAPLIDSTYMVTNPNATSGPVLRTVDYSSWLHTRRTYLTVRMREDQAK